jgi:hypothetical protein
MRPTEMRDQPIAGRKIETGLPLFVADLRAL